MIERASDLSFSPGPERRSCAYPQMQDRMLRRSWAMPVDLELIELSDRGCSLRVISPPRVRCAHKDEGPENALYALSGPSFQSIRKSLRAKRLPPRYTGIR